MSILFCSHSDTFDQELRRLFLPNLPIPARGPSGDLPVPGRYYDFEVTFIHQPQYSSFLSAFAPDGRLLYVFTSRWHSPLIL